VQVTAPAAGPIVSESSERVAGSNFELWSWYFFRLSGLLLVFLALGHLVIMHLVNNVDTIDYDWVAARWATLGWRMYDWLLLSLALLHGMNGLRVVVDDYVHRHGWRVVAMSTLWTLTLAFMALGTLAVVTFQPPGR